MKETDFWLPPPPPRHVKKQHFQNVNLKFLKIVLKKGSSKISKFLKDPQTTVQHCGTNHRTLSLFFFRLRLLQWPPEWFETSTNLPNCSVYMLDMDKSWKGNSICLYTVYHFRWLFFLFSSLEELSKKQCFFFLLANIASSKCSNTQTA